jgi:uncharacterized RDD family membrane protein YckC
MARSPRSPEIPGLFDLPLDAPGAPAPPRSPDRGPAVPPDEPPVEPPEEPPEEPSLFAAEEREGAPPPRDEPPPPPAAPTFEPAPLADRFRAGLADLALHAAVGLALLVGAELMGARPGLAELPAVALFLAVFSFLYSVVPLAFWGRTPGMAWSGLVARTDGGHGLTLGQTARRWLGGVVTVLLLGLPALLALGGRSLADRLSGTRTWREPAASSEDPGRGA